MTSTLLASKNMSTPVTSSVPTFLQTNHTGNAFTLSFRTTNFSSVNSTWLPTTEISLDRCKTFQYDFHKNIPLSSICAVCFVVGIIVSFVGYRMFKITMGIKILSLTSLLTYLILLERTTLSTLWCAVIAAAVGVCMGAIAAIVNTIGLIASSIIQGLFLTVITLIVVDFFISIHIIWVSIGLVSGLSLICAIVCMVWQKPVAILYITSYGAILVMIAADYYLDLFMITKYAYRRVLQVDGKKPCWFSWIVFGLWPFLMILGCCVQFLKTAKGYSHKKATKHKVESRKNGKDRHRRLYDNGDVIAQAWIQTGDRDDTLDKRHSLPPPYDYFPPDDEDMENTTLV